MKILATKYIAGQADEKEAVLVRQWIRMSKRNEECYIQLYETWHDILNAEPGIIDREQAYQLFLERTTGSKKLRWIMPGWMKVAAAAAVVVTISTVGYFYYRPTQKVQPWTEIDVSEGTTRKLVLADGTNIWINAGSHFRYNGDFGKTSRTVYLDGEAYFDIAKSKDNIPFLIKTKNFTIRDIGTIFNIKAYSDEPLEATVIEGKISVEGKLSTHDIENSKVFLEKKQVLKINSQPEGIKERIKVSTIDSSQVQLYNGWKDNFLVFDEISLKELAKIIERRYDVEMVIGDKKLEEFTYTGSFRNVESIVKVMEIIKATTPVSYQVNGRVVTISAAN
jgi:ferric-dicitrate binding protein FerR (iron transport regulator)